VSLSAPAITPARKLKAICAGGSALARLSLLEGGFKFF